LPEGHQYLADIELKVKTNRSICVAAKYAKDNEHADAYPHRRVIDGGECLVAGMRLFEGWPAIQAIALTKAI